MIHKSTIRASIFPQISKKWCANWGNCGILALGAKNSIYLYKSTPSIISFIRTIEIPGGSNPISIEFHEILPLFAIATDNNIIFLFDCVHGQFISQTKQLNGRIISIKWCKNILICYTAAVNNNLLAIDFLYSIKNKNLLSSSNINDFFNSNENHEAKITWFITIKSGFINLEIESNTSCFKALLYSQTSNAFLIVSSTSPYNKPTNSIHSYEMSGVSNIQDACFHPQLEDILIVLFSTSAIFYDLKTSSIQSLFSDFPSTLLKMFPNEYSITEFMTFNMDYSFILFKCEELDLKNSNLIFKKDSILQIKRETISNLPPLLFASTKHYPNHIIAISAQYGIIMISTKHINHKNHFLNQTSYHLNISQCNLFVPTSISSFDSTENCITVFGTSYGSVIIINCIDGSVQSIYNVSQNYSKVSQVKIANSQIIYWVTGDNSGIIDLNSKKVKLFDKKRAGSVLSSAFSNDIIVFQRDKFVVSCNKSNNLINHANKVIEKPIFFDSQILAICAQHKSTATTISMFGNKSCFAVLLKNNQIHFFNEDCDSPILRLRSPEFLTIPISIAWKQNVFVTADINGHFIFYDFEYKSSRTENCPFGNLSKIEFEKEENGLFLHSNENAKLGFFTDSVSVCNYPVHSFSSSSDGLVTILTTGNVIKILLLRNWEPLINVAQSNLSKIFSSEDETLLRIIKTLNEKNYKNLDIRSRIDLAIIESAENGLLFASELLVIIKRYIMNFIGHDDFSLPLKFSIYSPNNQEMLARNKFRSLLINQYENPKNVILSALLYMQTGDIDSARECLLTLSSNIAARCIDNSDFNSSIYNTSFYAICALSASLLGSELNVSSISVLKGISINLFDANDITAALFLLTVIHSEILSAQILQERELWDESIKILKLIFNKSQDQKDFSTCKSLLRKAAHYFLDHGNLQKAIFLFASLGDFHPVLSILSQNDMDFLGYIILDIFGDTLTIDDYDADTSYNEITFESLEFLIKKINKSYKKANK